ncbi:uncharacterized protein B0P05DRAFT_550513 [Gilbertella persicaria]|uniref:uncharacterized protein n=1 Tax=Gilbertella persicaria TaxID=101096 RepID=UPI00221EEC75|nr:uncharacterized protein B0P05DRAFT_550513 [Gilbertella persicaria]KAI8070636.1 hypothetical protein B0P05DRAFT_550513 [Gilbertella persicaria]
MLTQQNDVEDVSILQKKYESMSFDEMSRHLAESNKQILEMFSATTSTTSICSQQQQEEDPEKKYTALFARSASNGDVEKVKSMLADASIRPLIDVNALDQDGTPPLIYAACFGKTEIAKILIGAGAQINAQDSFGWTALMWATNNNHEALVKILLEQGASSQTRSAKGRTVFDFVNTDNQKIIDILATNPRDSVSSTSSLLYRTNSSVSSGSSTGDNDFYYDPFMSEEPELKKKLFESTMALTLETIDDNEPYTVFHWDKCSPDQMFVFRSDDLDHILDTVITHIQLPLTNQQDIHVPANVIFLTARFAHYFSSPELLEQVLDSALSRMNKAVKTNTHNIHLLAFWMTNLTQLLFYLKKDTGLIVATAMQQLAISELISETYTMIIQDTEKRLTQLLPAMLYYEAISGMNQVNFADDWHRFFRRSMVIEGNTAISPHSITSLLSSILFVFDSYHVHPIIVVQVLAQCLHFMSCEIFNCILTNKKLLCRSKAMQIRMNFSHLEDWMAKNHLPTRLLAYLKPIVQLLQLLQCITHLKDLMDFINTTKAFDTLNASQIKRCVLSYRYEVNEDHIPEEIEKYAMQCAEDIARYQQKSRQSISLKRQSMVLIVNDDEDTDTKETKDSKLMLPFSVPTTAHMNNTSHEENIPIIPEEWMEKLDIQQASPSV